MRERERCEERNKADRQRKREREQRERERERDIPFKKRPNVCLPPYFNL